MPTTARSILVVLGLSLAACVARGPGPAPAGRPPPPAVEVARYEVPGPVAAPTEDRLVEISAAHEERALSIPVRVPVDLAGLPGATDPIAVRLYLPRGAGAGRRPLVLMSPVLGSSNLLTPTFAAAFTRRGWIAALVERKDLEFDPKVALATAEGEVRLLVQRSRQALDTLLLRPDVDPERLATFGVSAGSIVSAMVAGADTRFVGHVWILAGGPLADVLADTEEERFVRYGRALHETTGWDREELRRRLRVVLQTDPVALAPHVPREQVLLILARSDASVPTRHGWTLYEALGRPAVRLVPGGHRSCWACLPYIVQETTGFLAARLSDPAEGPPGARAGAR